MICTSYKNAPTCVLLSTFQTDPQLHPGSARLGGEERLLAAVASSSQATWAGCRLGGKRITAIHITEIRSLTLHPLCLVLQEETLQPVPGVCRAALHDGFTSR